MAWFKNYLGVCSVAGLVVAPCSRAVLEAVKKIADKPKNLTGTITCRCLEILDFRARQVGGESRQV